MVLHHVADRAGLVVIVAASLDAERLGHRDLHMVDVRAVPQRLEQNIGEAQGHQVLHRFLAEVVVDPEDAALGKHRADLVVDDGGARAVPADRLLHDDAGTVGLQPLRADALGERTEQVGRRRQIEGADALVGPQQGVEIAPAGVARRVGGNIIETRQKALERRAGVVVDRGELHQGVLHSRAELAAIDLSPRHADDPGRFGELVAALAVEQGRIKLAEGQIPGAAEDDQIERLNLDVACGHDASQCCDQM